MRDRIRKQKWYSYAVAACIAVAFYVLLVHLRSITDGIATFIGYFGVVILGGVIAYVINPLAKMMQHSLFKGVKNDKANWYLSIGAAVIILLMVIGILLRIMIPQITNSIVMLVSNMDGYIESLKSMTVKLGRSEQIRIYELLNLSGDVAERIQNYLAVNAGTVVQSSAELGKSIFKWIVAFILSIYMLASKDSIKRELSRILSRLMPEQKYHNMILFIARCDKILIDYIIASLADALIIGSLNALFMSIIGMEYVGLISVVVGVTNLIPTFGPVVGGVVGALILFLVKPIHALIFIIFTIILQFMDPYFIKPKLFGNTLGVSGLLILMSVIVCGNIFGVVGLLIAIPLAAIVDYIYKEGIVVLLEKRKSEHT